jgi:5-methyltetrahydrofolate--homocysteine methyltransferase
MLQAAGLAAGECPEEWNISHPEAVRAVARAYAAAGSDLILTNTFGGSPCKLAKTGHGDCVAQFNAAGARLSLEGAPQCMVAGSVGPTGEFLAPFGDMDAETMESVFAAQIGPMFDAGLTAVCIETFSAVEEAACAVRAARCLKADADILVTFTFQGAPGAWNTMMGVTPAAAAAAMQEAGASVVGANCGNGIEQMISITREFRDATDLPILIHANAGMPELVDGQTLFRQTPEVMAAHVEALVEAGASIIGGCCGTTPAHIAAIREAVNRLRG